MWVDLPTGLQEAHVQTIGAGIILPLMRFSADTHESLGRLNIAFDVRILIGLRKRSYTFGGRYTANVIGLNHSSALSILSLFRFMHLDFSCAKN